MKKTACTNQVISQGRRLLCILLCIVSANAFSQDTEQASQLLFDYFFERRELSIRQFDSIVSQKDDTKHQALKWIRTASVTPEKFNQKDIDSSYDGVLKGIEGYYLLTQEEIDVDRYLEIIENAQFPEKDHLWEALFLNKAANFYRATRKYSKSIEVGDKVIAILNESSYSSVGPMTTKVSNLYNSGQRDSIGFYAKKIYHLAFEDVPIDPYTMSSLGWNAGILLQASGATGEAQYYLENAVKYHLLSYGKDVRAISRTVVLADNFFYSLDLKKAEYYANQALEIQNTLGKDTVPLYERSLLASSFTKIYLSQKKYVDAIAQIDPIIKECKEAYSNGSSLTIRMLRDKADVLIAQKKYELAEVVLLEAELIAEKVNRLYTTTGVYDDLSKVYEVMELPEKALVYLEKEETLLREGNFYDSELGSYNLLKKLRNTIELDDLDTAKHLGKNLEEWIQKTKSESPAKLQARIALQKLKLYEAQKLKTEESLQEAQQYSDALITTFIKDKSQLDLEGSKIFYGEIISRGLQDALEIAYMNWEASPQESFYTTALRIMEINKSSTLLDGIKELKLNAQKRAPEDLKQLEIDLVKERSEQERLCDETNDQSLCATRIVDLTKQIDSVTTVYKKEYPDYYRARTLSLSEPITYYQSKFCDEETMIIEYAVFNNWIYRLDITKEQLDIKRFKKVTGFDDTLSELREALQNRKGYDTLFKKIDFLLPTEILPSITKLLIVTDRNLALIPFDILPYKESALINTYDISYAGSLQLLDEQYKLTTSSNDSWLGFAPMYTGTLQIDNATEINTLKSITKGIAFTGLEATKKKFVSESPKYGILHLATHGELNNINPMNNKLLFSGASENDLSVQEVYTLDLSAGLAVLSACDTGNGKVEVGDGVMSMSRAFSYAGVASTVTSLWKVPDQETKQIMNLFYRYLREGKSKSNALRLAKQEYLKVTSDPELRHPYYWAGFVLTGDASPLYSSNYKWVYILISIVLLLFVGRYMLSRKRKKQL